MTHDGRPARRKPLPPGRRARRASAVLLLLGAGLVLVAYFDWRGESDLRDLGALSRTTAPVVDVNDHRRGPDTARLRFEVNGSPTEAKVPVSDSARLRAGASVEVAYVPAAPDRVRTVEHWSPMYGQWATYAAMTLLAGLLAGAAGLLSAVRRGATEATGEEHLQPGPQDPLGERILAADPRLLLLPVPVGILLGVFLGFVGASVPGNSAVAVWAVALGFAAVYSGAFVLIAWWHRLDGVWATPEHIVVRKHHTVQRWRWDQLHALAFSDGEAPTELRAKADGDRFDEPGPILWGTIANPPAGAKRKWQAYRRLRQLADEHGVPFDEEEELPLTRRGKVQYG